MFMEGLSSEESGGEPTVINKSQDLVQLYFDPAESAKHEVESTDSPVRTNSAFLYGRFSTKTAIGSRVSGFLNTS